MRILVADDDQNIVDLLSIYLRNEDFEVVKAFDGEEAWQVLSQGEVDLAILDVMMPKMEGIEVVEKARRADISTPIIIASAKTADHDKIEGLITGADDYVTKPFNPLEVIARVKSLLRRERQYGEKEAQASNEIEVGPLVIRKDSHEVQTLSGEQINLTAIEFNILHLLASHPNQVFSAEDIFEQVWNDDSGVSAKTVMVHVSHLRDKIARATGGEKVVQTVWGVGYKIEA